MKNQILEFENIVVGYGPEAVFFAFRNNFPIILTKEDYVVPFDMFFDTDKDLSDYNTVNECINLRMEDGEQEVGLQVSSVYRKILMTLSMLGKVININNDGTTVLKDEFVEITYEYGFKTKIKFDKCFVFDIGSAISNISNSSLVINDDVIVHDFFSLDPCCGTLLDKCKLRGLKYQKEFWVLDKSVRKHAAVYDYYIVIVSSYKQDQMLEDIARARLIQIVSEDKIRKSPAFRKRGINAASFHHEFRRVYKRSMIKFDSEFYVDKQSESFEDILAVPLVRQENKKYIDYIN